MESRRMPSTQEMLEAILDIRQPLVALGWRLDYERDGLSRPGLFVPLADLKAIALARLEGTPEQPSAETRQAAGGIPQADLLAAIHALEMQSDPTWRTIMQPALEEGGP